MSARRIDDDSADVLRAKIMQAIEACEDKSIKVVLLMQLELLNVIVYKIDAMLRDEEALRELVLNGDADTHAQDHRDWRAFKAEWTEMRPAMAIAMDRHLNGGYCDYANRMLAREKADADSRRKVRDSWLANIAWAITVLIAVAVTAWLTGRAPQ